MKKDLITPLSINMPKHESDHSTDEDVHFSSDPLGAGDFINRIKLQCKETEDNFIFNCIEPFIDSISSVKISKQDLVEAVQYINLRKGIIDRYGYDIGNDCNQKTAVEMHNASRLSYCKGHIDGYNEAINEMQAYLSGKEKENGEEEN